MSSSSPLAALAVARLLAGGRDGRVREPLEPRKEKPVRPTSKALGCLAATLAVAGALAANAGGALAAHVSCGDVLTTDTTLDSDLVCPNGNGLIVGAANIDIDLNGHTISGAPASAGLSYGVFSLGNDAPTIRGGTIEGFDIGVYVSLGDDALVRNLTVLASTYYGIDLHIGSGHDVIGNTVSGSGDSGIHIDVSADNDVFRNRVTDNGGHGIEISAGQTIVDDNVARRNGGNGIFMAAGTGSFVWGNTASANTADGILVAASTAQTDVKRNLTRSNGDDGVDVDSASTTLRRNTAENNADWGFETVAGVVDAGLNAATGNGTADCDPAHLAC